MGELINMKKSFAIIIVCYNRISGIKRLVKQLEKVNYEGRKDITLVFSIDNSGTRTVEDYAREYHWPYGDKVVRTFEKRQGLRNHIMQCGDYTNNYDIITIIEDDIFVSDSMYAYAYQAAEYYWDDTNIAGISLYSFQKNWLKWIYRFEPQKQQYDSYFLKVAQSWGQVWTLNKWKPFKEWYQNHLEFDYKESIPAALFTWPESSWLKYHDRYCIENDKYFVYPYVSLSTNYSDPGEHATHSVADHQVELQYGKALYSFPAFSNSAVKYDEYMNRVFDKSIVGLPLKDVCVDFWGTKPACLYKKYLITTKILPFKIIKSFSLALRPIELNLIEEIDGNEIFVYDTMQKDNENRRINTGFSLMLYSLRTHDAFSLLPFSCWLWLKEVVIKIKVKLNKTLKKKV